jgi:hypothetical protein
MTRTFLAGSLAALAAALLAAPAGAGDLKGTPRTLTKQPTYAGKPGYALLVFGEKAEQRVWLVLDGDTLYVDRNGNGDLTESGEKVAPDGEPESGENDAAKFSSVSFDGGEIPGAAGAPPYEGLTVQRIVMEPKAGAPAEFKGGTFTTVAVTLEQVCEQSATPTFAPKPDDAPIVHFGGPLVVGVAQSPDGRPPVLFHANDEQELTVQIGSLGVGPGSWAPIAYTQVPDTVHPVVEIAFPAAKAGDPPVQGKFTLDARC